MESGGDRELEMESGGDRELEIERRR